MVLHCFVGMNDHMSGEKLALVCIEICTTYADVLIMASDLIHVQVWISQWLRFASQGLTLWRKVKTDCFWQRIPIPCRVTWRLVKTMRLCCRALKVDGRWNKFHSSTKPAFYLCLCELIHLHCRTALSFFFYFSWTVLLQRPQNPISDF